MKMKIIKKNIISRAKVKTMTLAIVTGVLSACSSATDGSSFDTKGVLPDDGVIRIQQPEIAMISSRASTTDYNGSFGMFVTHPSDAKYSYPNVCMKYLSESYMAFNSDAAD